MMVFAVVPSAMAVTSCATEPTLDGVVEVASSPYAGCARTASGSVACWYDRSSAPDARKVDEEEARSARFVDGIAATQIEVSRTACALGNDARVRCWIRPDPDQVAAPFEIRGLADVKDFVLGSTYGCARTSSNVMCWGGALPAATAVPGWPGPDVAELAMGTGDDVCGRLASGAVECVELSDLVRGSAAPRRIEGLVALTIGRTGATYAAITPGQGVVVWSTRDATPTTVAIPPVTNAQALVDRASCALLANGTTRCWELGFRGPFETYPEFRPCNPDQQDCDGALQKPFPPPAGVRVEAAQSFRGCAATNDGRARCWGGAWEGLVIDGDQ
jgi:hypothetical protein